MNNPGKSFYAIYLDLKDNNLITDDSISLLTNLTNLTKLDLSRNKGITDKEFHI